MKSIEESFRSNKGGSCASIDVVIEVLDSEVAQDEETANLRWDGNWQSVKPSVDVAHVGLQEVVQLELEHSSVKSTEWAEINCQIRGFYLCDLEHHIHIVDKSSEAECGLGQSDGGSEITGSVSKLGPELNFEGAGAAHLSIGLWNTNLTNFLHLEEEIKGNVSTIVILDSREEEVAIRGRQLEGSGRWDVSVHKPSLNGANFQPRREESVNRVGRHESLELLSVVVQVLRHVGDSDTDGLLLTDSLIE